MKRKSIALFTLIAFVVTMSILVFSACDGATKEGKGAKLLFFDDFDTLNTEVWNVYTAKTETDEQTKIKQKQIKNFFIRTPN